MCVKSLLNVSVSYSPSVLSGVLLTRLHHPHPLKYSLDFSQFLVFTLRRSLYAFLELASVSGRIEPYSSKIARSYPNLCLGSLPIPKKKKNQIPEGVVASWAFN